jgi:hypothetical protein
MADQPMMIQDPLVVMFRGPGGNVITHIHRPPDLGHESFGLLVCDLVRHIANAYQVRESQVWRWVDKERRRPTTAISRPS